MITMKLKAKYIFKSIVGSFFLTMLFFSCTQKSTVVNVVDFNEVAQGVGKEVVVKYTDSGRLAAKLITPLMKDFTHVEFPYYEFPEGVELVVFDEKGGQSKVFADYATQYEKTKLVDMQGNVRIITSDSTRLNAPQLYWNQALHWVYTDQPYQIYFKNGAENKGEGFDANEDFTSFKSRTNIGTQILEE